MSVATAQDNGVRLLKPRQAAFLRAYLKTWCAADAARAIGISEASARSSGCRMLKKIRRIVSPELLSPEAIATEGQQAAIEQQRQAALDAQTALRPVTRESIQGQLDENRNAALKTNQVREANQATLLLGKTIGLFQDGPPAGVNIAVLNDPGLAAGVLSRITDGEEIIANADD